MDQLLRFLIWTLNTRNGKKNSAAKAVQAAYDAEFKRVQKRFRESIKGHGHFNENEYKLNEEVKNKILDAKKREVYKETLFRFRMIRIRAKISYSAFRNHMTINELFLTQILESFTVLQETRSIPLFPYYT